MAAFEAPTVNDFISQLHMQIERHVGLFLKTKNNLDSKAGRTGTSHSSMYVLQLLDALDEHHGAGIAAILGELKRAISCPELNATELRSLTGPRCDELLAKLIDASRITQLLQSFRSSQMSEITDSRFQQARQNTQFWLRQFDIGWDEPVEPESLKLPPISR